MQKQGVLQATPVNAAANVQHARATAAEHVLTSAAYLCWVFQASF
jgi:hypothetical protein